MKVGESADARLGTNQKFVLPAGLTWWGIGGLILALVVLAAMWRQGSQLAKMFLLLLIVSTLLARWDNTFKPWLFGGK